MTTILVTGATGTVGSILIPLLRARGATVRALVRDQGRAAGLAAAGVHAVVGGPESLPDALDGADAVFLACGNVPEQVDVECAVIAAAQRAGTRRIVKLSARGAAVDAPVAYWHWHGLIERSLQASGVPAVILQPGFLMTNLLGAAEQIRAQGMLFAPAADARIAMIDPADVAAVATVALTTDGHDGHSYVLTGPAAVDYHQVAAELSAATDRHVGFVDIPPTAAGQAMVQAGLPPFAAEQIVRVFDALRAGAQASTTGTVQDIIGRPPRDLAWFARDHAAAFRGATVSAVSG